MHRLVNRHPFASGSNAPARILAEQGSVLAEGSAQSRIDVPGVDWDLEVFNPAIDEAKATEKGLIALIVVASVILSCLLLLLLTSNKEYVQLLREQVATHGALEKANDHLTHAKRVLEAEKQQRETLVERQLKLISCFDARDRKSSGRATLGRIAEARQQISSTTPQHDHGEDNVQLLELLGNGTFGKVHRGLWRGTVVAIKIMLLPANMSGAEKREKMVVWEAAISSSLTHPNIVQTYSYSIKPIQGSKEQQQANSQGDLQSLGSAIQICGATCSPLPSGEFDGTKHTSPDCPAFLCAKEEQRTSVHSFEVQLVLEYCDKGCLRDALDQGVFMGPTGLNYPAILDSAEDIARAMLHLHCNNVLHMDLKARNVMLASSGTEGRGVCCKIADFGLAVRMGSMETHMSEVFQGTATHMAPEVLLEGRVSKAADVYAFGITLWELFTGGEPYRGVPRALLGHKVAREQKRPSFPPVMPEGYKALLRKASQGGHQ
ncbi:kinase-like domain-containing protein [Dunaliella salina]|uniref:Kinase-like domain-containing protein n=1 Tax=Dunaliella salina TaxID=3046 RepID=A0ABQ7G9R5_DUNSA|nr:kinase-like domain-containing protein [Dunaliella salina]|eukprot:KAF5831352.1 kinase-like domain-containing protein [Dunaliella salina]